MSQSVVERPAHVPAEIVVDFDYMRPPGIAELGAYEAWDRLHAGPDIVWSPHHGGHWIVTREEDIRWVQATYDLFSHRMMSVPKPSEPFVMPPISTDPPEHARYRSVLNPAFARRAVADLADMARALTIAFAEEMRPRGGCEFVGEFARRMPVTVFLRMVDLPLDRRAQFVVWATSYMRAPTPAGRQGYLGQIAEYLASVVEERAAHPGEDLISRIIAARDGQRFDSEQQLVGMLLVLFLGGLDTVANLLSFTALHLATHPGHQQRLRDDPAIIPAAVEEYLRRHGLSNTSRYITRDFEHKGLSFKEGDMIMVPINLSGTDARAYADPFAIDFDRANRDAHNTFGNGAHRCPGATLARAEIGIFFEEFLPRIGTFRIREGERAETESGLVLGVGRLPLAWDT